MNRKALGFLLGTMSCIRGPETPQFSLPPHYTGTCFTSEVPEAEAAFGSWIVVGDIDGDSFPDVAIAAPHETVSSNPDAGAVYVFRGPDFAANQAIRVTVPMNEGGPAPGDQFGTNRTGVAIGQLDGQGGAELLVGADNRDLSLSSSKTYTDLGAVYVFHWDETVANLTHALTLYPPHDDLANIPKGTNQHFGVSVATADINSDGFDDIVIGAGGAGRAYVYFGTQTITQIGQSPTETVMLLPPTDKPGTKTFFGRSVAVGHLDNDGHTDVAVGEESWWPETENITVGRVTIYDGASLVSGTTIPDTPCEQICYQTLQPPGMLVNGLYGEHLSIQDFSGDGLADLSVFAELGQCQPINSANYLYQSTGVQGQWFSQMPSQTLCSPDPGTYRFGRNAEAINWDGDGIPDALVNEVVWDDPNGCGQDLTCVASGRVHIFLNPFSGGSLSPYLTFYSPQPTCYCVASPTEGAHFGVGLRVADLNLDGGDDIMIGARHQPVNGLPQAGAVFLFEKP